MVVRPWEKHFESGENLIFCLSLVSQFAKVANSGKPMGAASVNLTTFGIYGCGKHFTFHKQLWWDSIDTDLVILKPYLQQKIVAIDHF